MALAAIATAARVSSPVGAHRDNSRDHIDELDAFSAESYGDEDGDGAWLDAEPGDLDGDMDGDLEGDRNGSREGSGEGSVGPGQRRRLAGASERDLEVLDDVSAVLSQMSLHGVAPDKVTVNTALLALARRGLAPDAVVLFEHHFGPVHAPAPTPSPLAHSTPRDATAGATARVLNPDEKSFAALAVALARSGGGASARFPDPIVLLARGLRCALNASSNSSRDRGGGGALNVVLVNGCLRALVAQRRNVEALALFRLLLEAAIEAQTWHASPPERATADTTHPLLAAGAALAPLLPRPSPGVARSLGPLLAQRAALERRRSAPLHAPAHAHAPWAGATAEEAAGAAWCGPSGEAWGAAVDAAASLALLRPRNDRPARASSDCSVSRPSSPPSFPSRAPPSPPSPPPSPPPPPPMGVREQRRELPLALARCMLLGADAAGSADATGSTTAGPTAVGSAGHVGAASGLGLGPLALHPRTVAFCVGRAVAASCADADAATAVLLGAGASSDELGSRPAALQSGAAVPEARELPEALAALSDGLDLAVAAVDLAERLATSASAADARARAGARAGTKAASRVSHCPSAAAAAGAAREREAWRAGAVTVGGGAGRGLEALHAAARRLPLGSGTGVRAAGLGANLTGAPQEAASRESLLDALHAAADRLNGVA